LQDSGFPPPKFESHTGAFSIRFSSRETKEADIPALALSQRQQLAIEYIKKHGSLSNSQYQQIANISKATATRELKCLTEAGFLVSSGIRGKGIVYRIRK